MNKEADSILICFERVHSISAVAVVFEMLRLIVSALFLWTLCFFLSLCCTFQQKICSCFSSSSWSITFFGNLAYFTGVIGNTLLLAQAYLFIDLWLLADGIITLQAIRCSCLGSVRFLEWEFSAILACHTIQHRAVLIIFPLNLHTITITLMLSRGGDHVDANCFV